jgi:hypothetical protein
MNFLWLLDGVCHGGEAVRDFCYDSDKNDDNNSNEDSDIAIQQKDREGAKEGEGKRSHVKSDLQTTE